MVIGLVVAPVAAAGILVAVDRAFFSDEAQYSWPPEPCVRPVATGCNHGAP
jgi:hypothetical protein